MSLPRLHWRPVKPESTGVGPRNLNGSSSSPSAFDDLWGREITGSDDGKVSPKDESKKYQFFFFFFSCLSYEMLSIWANEWMTELPPFKMGWKVYRRELWQVPSFMDHMLFFLLFFYPIGDASMKFFSVSVCSPLGLLNILKTQSCSPQLCRFIWTPGMVSGSSPVDREQLYGSNKCVPKVYAFEFVTL